MVAADGEHKGGGIEIERDIMTKYSAMVRDLYHSGTTESDPHFFVLEVSLSA